MTTKWKDPAYPGDAVQMQMLQRGDVLGDIRIQQYQPDQFCVATFLPGIPVQLPGDTPKTEPEESSWHTTCLAAVTMFETQLDKAHALGWLDYEPGRFSSLSIVHSRKGDGPVHVEIKETIGEHGSPYKPKDATS